MKLLRTFLYSLFFVAAGFAFAAEQQPPKPITECIIHTPFGMPGVTPGHPVICRTGYILEHDPDAKIPNWVSWTIKPENVLGCAPREDAFAADQSLPPSRRAEPKDYAGSGYDQGHLAPNADMSYDPAVARESFYMSNMSPQLPALNRGTWKNLESATRAWVYTTNHAHTVIAGNVYSTSSKTIGQNKVVVPDVLFKIVIDDVEKKSYAFLFDNKAGLDQDYSKYQVTVEDVEKTAKITFSVPDDKKAKNKLPAADLKTTAEAKKKKCKGGD